MRSAFSRAKEQVAKAVADQTRLERDLAKQKQEMARWEQNAVKAVEQGNDTLAKEALRRKNEHLRFAAQYEHELTAQTANVERLKDSLRELESKIEELDRKKNLLKSRQKRAEAQDAIYQTLEGINAAGAIDTISRMEDKIEEMSALADARQELSSEFQGDNLERQFQELESQGGDVDAELLAMKQRMQIENKG
jgi:phage shock protein A